MAKPDLARESGSGVQATSNPLMRFLPQVRTRGKRTDEDKIRLCPWDAGVDAFYVMSDPLQRSGLETQRPREFPGGAARLEGVVASGTNQSSLHRARAPAVAAQTRVGGGAAGGTGARDALQEPRPRGRDRARSSSAGGKALPVREAVRSFWSRCLL